jgi:cytochrome c553
MSGEVFPRLLDEGPEPSASALLLAVLLMSGGERDADEQALPELVDLTEEEGQQELQALASRGIVELSPDGIRLTLSPEQWREVALYFAAGMWQATESTLEVAQVVEQTSLV